MNFKKALTQHSMIIITCLSAVSVFHANGYAQGEKGWVHPFVEVSETFDDNVFLTENNEDYDLITRVTPGVEIEPNLARHKFKADYYADLVIFSHFNDQNHYDHTSHAEAELNFNKLHFNAKNKFRYFSDRSGSEDVNRVPRTQDHASAGYTYNFRKMDVSATYYYKWEDYRTSESIGNYKGEPLTYQDLDRNEHMGEIEAALKIWPKTSLLFLADFGGIMHRTGKKPDSKYFDVLVGLHGEPWSKLTVEGNIGFRGQYYAKGATDYNNIVFNASLVEEFTPRNILRLDFIRTTNETIYKDNPYYVSTFVGGTYRHGFTDRIYADLMGSYQRDGYPVKTREPVGFDRRYDNIWTGGASVAYETPWGFITELKYLCMIKDSNFGAFDYNDNTLTLTARAEF